jgi:CRP-like cAMP-binding protein
MPARARFVDLTERIIYLRAIPVGAMLPPPVLKIIASSLRETSFAAGESLMREGAPISALRLLTEGRLALVRKGKPFGTLAPPQSLGFLGILARGDGTYDATAEVATRCLELDSETLLELLEDHIELLQATLRYLCERLLHELKELPGEILGGLLEGTPRDLPERDLDPVERMVYLRSLGVFDKTNLNSLAALAQTLVQCRFEPGAVVWRTGEPATCTGLVLRGRARCVTDDGQRRWVAGANSALGGIEAIAGMPRWYELSAETPLVMFKLPTEPFMDILEDDFPLAVSFVALFANLLVDHLERKAAAGQSTVGVLRNVTKLGDVPVGA